MSILTVSQLNKIIAFKINSDIKLKSLMVEGEVSNFVNHYKTGHFYFTLKDGNSSVKAVMFAQNAKKLKFEPYDGLKVILSCAVEVFERDGLYQLYVSDINPVGLGKVHLAFEQLKEKLEQKGFFKAEYKKEIPYFPKKVGVVTSLKGAALQDILNILQRRNPLLTVTIYPCAVQGKDADLSIARMVETADNDDNDVIILGRGGGSSEDLSPFNSELLAGEIFYANTPIISAVGHEVDYSISDFVADLRAPTPSAAAELCCVDIKTLVTRLQFAENKMTSIIKNKIEISERKIDNLTEKINLLSPENRINNFSVKLENSTEKLHFLMENYLLNKENALEKKVSVLSSLSPLNVISRGYSIVKKDDIIVKNTSDLDVGDKIKILLYDGEIEGEVTKK